eukprot:CAMPEP_0172377162 /NCGR_PEP_ID=MMETSP1060-20121228/68757_1 /TAXON_ID=37318 /ORGANISM="Pseudo-nitzschia pungens, Strain cf. cingulata" /LENGTH=859 /DNA_ID=CAMNT_0013104833 /DNA_START=286 /DNA_END=2866 /DNA_ORIENTATION=+
MEEQYQKAATEVEPSGPGAEAPESAVRSINNSDSSTSQSVPLPKSKSKSKPKTKTTKKKKSTKNNDHRTSALKDTVESSRVSTEATKNRKKKKKKKPAYDVESLDLTSSTNPDDVPKSVKTAQSLSLKSSSQIDTHDKALKEKKERRRNVARTKSFEPKKYPKRNVNRSKSFDEAGSTSFSSASLSKFHTSHYSGEIPLNDGRGGTGRRGRGSISPGRVTTRVGALTPGEKRSSEPMRSRERKPIQERVKESRSHSVDSTSIDSASSMDHGHGHGHGHEEDIDQVTKPIHFKLKVPIDHSTDLLPILNPFCERIAANPFCETAVANLFCETAVANLYCETAVANLFCETAVVIIEGCFTKNSSSKSILRNSSSKSILRNSSSHHRGMLHQSSHHTLLSQSKHKRRVNVNLAPDPYSGFESDVESDSNDGGEVDDDDNSFALEECDDKPQKNDRRALVRSLSQTMKKSINNLMAMDMSGHSRGLGTGSSHHTNAQNKNVSQPKVAPPEFEDDYKFFEALRYIRILAPHPNEHPIKKKIRIVTWLALFLDFLNALVAIITYGGETTQCCEKSIMSAFGGSVDWDKTILVVTSLYMLLIFLEVLPVMRDAFPFNLFNPFIGFLITFAVFFSDSIMEAAIMWTVEALAVGCEVFNYQLRIQLFGKHKTQLEQTKKEIQKLRRIKRKVKDRYEHGQVLVRGGSDDILTIDLDGEDFDGDESLLGEDMEMQKSNADIATATGHSTHTTMSDIGNIRETRLLRERRHLMNSQAEDERDLHYHLVGVSINVFLVILSLLMIVIIAKNGGMCIKGMQFGNIFKNDQLEKCFKYKECENPGDCEEHCPRDENGDLTAEAQCYYPYGIGL